MTVIFSFQKTDSDEDEWGKYSSKVVVVLIHQTVGLGVSATAARRQLIIASAAGDEARAGRRQDDEDVLSGKENLSEKGGGGGGKRRSHFSSSHGAFGGVGTAYGDKGKDAGPEGVVGQLPPAPLVHDGALVRDATEQVDGRGDQRDDAEDTAGPQRLLRLTDAAAGGHGARFEEEGALVRVGADEREVRFRGERVPVAGEGDEGGFPSDGFFAFGALVAFAVVVVVVVVVVIVVIVVWDVELAREEAVGFGLAGGAVGVIQDELATSEEWLRGCLPVWCTVRGCLRVLGDFFFESAHPMEYVFFPTV